MSLVFVFEFLGGLRIDPANPMKVAIAGAMPPMPMMMGQPPMNQMQPPPSWAAELSASQPFGR